MQYLLPIAHVCISLAMSDLACCYSGLDIPTQIPISKRASTNVARLFGIGHVSRVRALCFMINTLSQAHLT